MSCFSGQREVRERGDEDYGPTVYKSSMYMNEDPEVSQESVFQLFPSPSKSEQNVPIEFYKTLDLRVYLGVLGIFGSSCFSQTAQLLVDQIGSEAGLPTDGLITVKKSIEFDNCAALQASRF